MSHSYNTRSKKAVQVPLRSKPEWKPLTTLTIHCVHIPTRGTFTYTDNDLHHVKSTLHNILDLIEENGFQIDLVTEFFECVYRHPYVLSVYKGFGDIIRQKVAEFKVLAVNYTALHDALAQVESIL